ncbi:MAG: nucleotidyl transferase AbiEii/AbiGii toxin family protein [Candidatus Doudnabacteria bacterium]|nr:nucleotidyl transferase AbiEii/AbiGii toxin family protein [Candidatus Doudnabacteria bacterium]
MHLETINAPTKRVLEKIAKSGIAKDFYLAGGTALAIQLGHRMSEDLDWFSPDKFSGDDIKKGLSRIGSLELIGEETGTVHGILDGVRVSFFYYGYPWLYPLVDFENIKLADERDIAAMKIDAASSRGSKKDFIDLYFLMEKYPLAELLHFFEKRYKKIKFNKLHILKSLTFFEDAQQDPMPIMIKPADWDEVKKKIAAAANKTV